MVVTAGPVPTTLLHEMNENEMLKNAIAVKINRVIIVILKGLYQLDT